MNNPVWRKSCLLVCAICLGLAGTALSQNRLLTDGQSAINFGAGFNFSDQYYGYQDLTFSIGLKDNFEFSVDAPLGVLGLDPLYTIAAHVATPDGPASIGVAGTVSVRNRIGYGGSLYARFEALDDFMLAPYMSMKYSPNAYRIHWDKYDSRTFSAGFDVGYAFSHDTYFVVTPQYSNEIVNHVGNPTYSVSVSVMRLFGESSLASDAGLGNDW